jgi:hypothetical protein
LQASHQALPAASRPVLLSPLQPFLQLRAPHRLALSYGTRARRVCQVLPEPSTPCRAVSVSYTGRRVGIAPAASRERRARRPWSQATAREKPALVRSRTRSRALFCPLPVTQTRNFAKFLVTRVRPPRNFANFLGRNEVGRTFLINTTHDQPRQQPRSVSPPV